MNERPYPRGGYMKARAWALADSLRPWPTPTDAFEQREWELAFRELVDLDYALSCSVINEWVEMGGVTPDLTVPMFVYKDYAAAMRHDAVESETFKRSWAERTLGRVKTDLRDVAAVLGGDKEFAVACLESIKAEILGSE